MTDDELHTLAGPYALDGLSDSEVEAFEAHLPNCESCTIAVVEFELTAAELGEVTPVSPPDVLKQRILAQVAQTAQVAPPVSSIDELARRRRIPGRVLTMVAAATLVVVGAFAALTLTGGGDETDELIAASDAVTVELEATREELAGASVEVVWSPDQDRAMIVASGLQDPGVGKTYELWFLHDDGMAPAGLFVPTDGETQTLVDLGLPGVAGLGWGITIEPAEGSDQPTGEVLFRGSI